MAGQKDGAVTMFDDDDLLASTAVMEKISITIDKAVIDAGNPDGSSTLRAGLVLTRNAVSGKYGLPLADADDPGGDEADAIVLVYPKEMNGVNDIQAAGYLVATLWADRLIAPAAFAWEDCQRLTRMNRL